MAKLCSQCGSALTEGNAFCTKCGAQAGGAATQAAGVTASSAAASGAPDIPSSTTPAHASATSQPVAAGQPVATISLSAAPSLPLPPAGSGASGSKSSQIPKIAIVVVAMIVVLIVSVIAGVTYVSHRAREKAAQIEARAAAKTTQNGNNPAAVGGANAPIQNAQQGGGTAPNGNPSSGSAPVPGSNSTSTANPGSDPSIAAASAAANAALMPLPAPTAGPIVPVAATGDQARDWALQYERTVGGPEADLVVRTGDINNLGFGWPQGFDPFSGQSTPPHAWPTSDHIPPQAAPGTDRILLGTSVMPVSMVIQHTAGQADQIVIDSVVKAAIQSDGYSGSLSDCFSIRDSKPAIVPPDWATRCTRQRQLTAPTPIILAVGALPSDIHAVVLQIFADDFQPVPMHSRFQVSLNGTRIPTFEQAINSLDQTGPIGKLLTLKLLPEYWPLLNSDDVKLLIDDPTTHVGDGYAVDFVRILVNPHQFKYQVSLTATVTDADKHTPITGATVNAALESAATDRAGKCELKGIPAGLVVASAAAPGYDENSVTVDLPAGKAGHAELQLHAHQESTAALEKAIAQNGTATIYGIHFDTDSSKLRPDSLPALNAVLGLINNHPGSRWIIAGHTDNQGSEAHNLPLSQARAKSVVTWLTTHGVTESQLVPQGFGTTRPVADNATANGRALNRRVEVALTK